MRRAVPMLILLAACGGGGSSIPDGGAGPDGTGVADAPGIDAPIDALLHDAARPATCGEALPLALGTSIVGTTEGASNDFVASCGGGAAGDTVFVVTLDAASDLIVSTEDPVTGFNAVVSVRTTCDDAGTQIGCAATGRFGDGLVLFEIPAGSYYVIVDGIAGAEGVFRLSARARPVLAPGEPCDPAGDANRCGAGSECRNDGGGPVCVDLSELCAMASVPITPGTLSDNTMGETDDYSPTCQSDGPAGDLIYRLDTADPIDLRAIATPTNYSIDMFDVILSVDSRCGDPTANVGCSDSTGGSSSETVTAYALPAGSYFIAVDGFAGRMGQFSLDLVARALTLADGAGCDPADLTVGCAPGLWCLAGACAPVTEVVDIAPNARFCDAQGPFGGDFVVDSDMTGSSDSDTYELVLATAASLHVETTDKLGGCDGDTRVRVYDSMGMSCDQLDASTPAPLADDDDGGAGHCSLLDPATTPAVANLAAGTYYVKVSYGGSGTGRYFLVVDVQ